MSYLEEYNHWLNSGVLEPEEVAELESIKDDEKEIESRSCPSGIRYGRIKRNDEGRSAQYEQVRHQTCDPGLCRSY